MKTKLITVLAALSLTLGAIAKNETKTKVTLTPTPPMGWNSWDCLGLDANETQIKAVADYMAANLKKYGWEYVVIDAGWYHPKDINTAKSNTYRPVQNLDKYGRLIPDTVKYPSAKAGVGFKALADYIHNKGLKFGIHVQRGIPWNAVAYNTPIKGTGYFAKEVANLKDTCIWSPIMKGVDLTKAGAQEYINSVYEQYAAWGVDFVKVDDMSYPYHKSEIEGVRKAIDNSGRAIVYSLSPGESPISEAKHLAENSNLWRVSGDFWDGWKYLKHQFELLRKWDKFDEPGRWPDADMLPIGKLRKTGGDAWIASLLGKTITEVTDEYSRFTDTEKYTLMTLWCIFKSPLILGGYLPENDAVTTKLITNAEVIAVNQKAIHRRELRNENGLVIWVSEQPGTGAKYVAMFNLNDGKAQEISVSWKELGLNGQLKVRNLWTKKVVGKFATNYTAQVEAHGCVLVRIGK
jgi:hypothetical protein